MQGRPLGGTTRCEAASRLAFWRKWRRRRRRRLAMETKFVMHCTSGPLALHAATAAATPCASTDSAMSALRIGEGSVASMQGCGGLRNTITASHAVWNAAIGDGLAVWAPSSQRPPAQRQATSPQKVATRRRHPAHCRVGGLAIIMPTLVFASEISRSLSSSSPISSMPSGAPSSSSKTAARLWRDDEVQASVMASLHNPFVRALAHGSLARCGRRRSRAPALIPASAAPPCPCAARQQCQER